MVAFVIEEMSFLAAGHPDLRVLPKNGVQGAGTRLLRARDHKGKFAAPVSPRRRLD
jgi:hypothetical protein